MKGQDLFKQLSEKSGIAADDKELVAFLTANPALEIPDTLANSFLSKLMNENEAKVYQPIKAHWTQQNLSGIDKKITDLLTELAVDDAVKNEILAEKNTYERVPLLVKKIQALEQKKLESGKGEKSALQAEINKLNGELTKLTTEKAAEIQRVKDTAAGEILNYAINANLAGRNFANKEIPKEANVATALFLLQKGLTDKKIKVVNDNNTLKLVRTDDTALPYTENHKEVSFDSFADSVLSANKMLSVGNPTPKPAPTPAPQGQPIEVPQELAAHYAEQIGAFQNGQ